MAGSEHETEGARQLWLFPEAAPPEVEQEVPDDALEAAASKLYPQRDLTIVYTKNKTVILSFRQDEDRRARLRAHECFRHAPQDLAEGIVRIYLGRLPRPDKRRISSLVGAWHQQHAEPPDSPSADELDHGTHHDLKVMLATVNEAYFGGSLDLDISFAPRPARRLMGRHERRTPRNLILVNPVLDSLHIKGWYLRFLIFHECLHEVMSSRMIRGRLVHHPPEFRRRESLHPDYARSKSYEGWLTGRGYPRLLRQFKERSKAKAESNATSAKEQERRQREADQQKG